MTKKKTSLKFICEEINFFPCKFNAKIAFFCQPTWSFYHVWIWFCSVQRLFFALTWCSTLEFKCCLQKNLGESAHERESLLTLLYFSYSPKKEKSEVKKKPKVTTHVVIEEPLYTIQKQVLDPVYYPTTDPVYDIAPVTSSHPQSSSLGEYGDMSMYGNGMSIYGTMLGPPVPPPTPGFLDFLLMMAMTRFATCA